MYKNVVIVVHIACNLEFHWSNFIHLCAMGDYIGSIPICSITKEM